MDEVYGERSREHGRPPTAADHSSHDPSPNSKKRRRSINAAYVDDGRARSFDPCFSFCSWSAFSACVSICFFRATTSSNDFLDVYGNETARSSGTSEFRRISVHFCLLSAIFSSPSSMRTRRGSLRTIEIARPKTAIKNK